MNGYMPRVADTEYISEYKIKVAFTNGIEKIVDCQKYLNGEIFQPLKDIENFKKIFADGWTVSWPNGADIAPETLYED